MNIQQIREASLLYARGDGPKSKRKSRKKKRKHAPVVYHVYMKSGRWFRFRDRILKRSGHKCEECKRPDNLQVHHLTYERLGYEKSQDVKVLCAFCHSLIDRHHMKQSGYAFLGFE